jgi:hypothetical protein
VALPLAAIPIIGNLLGKILDKVAKDKISDADRAALKLEAEKLLSDEGQEDVKAFYDFVVQYEGAGALMPKGIQYLRASVRPVLTYVFAGFFVWIVWHYITATGLPEGTDVALAVKLIFATNLITLGFWFGEKAIERSGLVELLKKK